LSKENLNRADREDQFLRLARFTSKTSLVKQRQQQNGKTVGLVLITPLHRCSASAGHSLPPQRRATLRCQSCPTGTAQLRAVSEHHKAPSPPCSARAHLVVHNHHSAGEEVMVGDDAGEPLCGGVLAVHAHPVPVQRVRTWGGVVREQPVSRPQRTPCLRGACRLFQLHCKRTARAARTANCRQHWHTAACGFDFYSGRHFEMQMVHLSVLEGQLC